MYLSKKSKFIIGCFAVIHFSSFYAQETFPKNDISDQRPQAMAAVKIIGSLPLKLFSIQFF